MANSLLRLSCHNQKQIFREKHFGNINMPSGPLLNPRTTRWTPRLFGTSEHWPGHVFALRPGESFDWARRPPFADIRLPPGGYDGSDCWVGLRIRDPNNTSVGWQRSLTVYVLPVRTTTIHPWSWMTPRSIRAGYPNRHGRASRPPGRSE